jgi:hypothetical protein
MSRFLFTSPVNQGPGMTEIEEMIEMILTMEERNSSSESLEDKCI